MFLAQLPDLASAAILFVVGAIVGGQVNRGIYRLAIDSRWISPWSRPHPDASPRQWLDRVPIVGWFGLQRDSNIHGTGYWVRPLLIEICMAGGFAWLYLIMMDGYLTVGRIDRNVLVANYSFVLEAQYYAYAALISLMMVATFIDFDEKTIPDAITVPGTFLGLFLAVVLPSCRPMETIGAISQPGFAMRQVIINSPKAWPGDLNSTFGLLVGCGCFIGWCLAIMPKVSTLRRGWLKGLQYLLVSSFRYGIPWMIMAVVGSIVIAVAWWTLAPSNDVRWQGLLTSLVGMAFSGGLIWSVRVVGWISLRKEAMGFGDVTLMAMIGAFWGWQSSILIFFLAPVAALFISLSQWLLTGRRDIAFGPYLCVGTLFVMLRWPHIWDNWAQPIFGLGWFIPQMMALCLIIMCGMLLLVRQFEQWRYGDQ